MSVCPEVNEDPEESEAIIREHIAVFRPAIIAGTSMGGLYALYADALVGQVESRKNARLLEAAGFTVVWSDKFGHRLNENVAKKIPSWLEGIS